MKVKSNTNDSPSDTDPNPDADIDEVSDNADIREMDIMLVKWFKKMKFRRAQRQGNFHNRSADNGMEK